MKFKTAVVFFVGALFLTTTGISAQTPPAPKEIEISGRYFKTYKVDDIKVKNIKELGSILDQVYDSEMEESFSRGKAWNSYGQLFGIVGGALIGYPLGQAMAGNELNKPVLFAGIGVATIGFVFVMNAEEHICLAVERYNTVLYEKHKIGLRADPFNKSVYLTLSW
ncbi:MAG: hypothetical protein RDU76_07845 [Candidatus Edwardsbacteria bacterium]|nr:hypothetical protein [Candidatus Edwardsbacteria bacterium]